MRNIYISILILVTILILTHVGSGMSQEARTVYTKDDMLYPYGTDTYYYLRLAEDVVDHGHVGEYLEDGTPVSQRMHGPSPRPIESGWYPYLLAPLIDAVGTFTAAYWLPVLLGVLSVLLVYWLGSQWSEEAGFLSGVIMAFHPFFVTWNHAGFADTNALNLLLSLAIVCCAYLHQRHWGWSIVGTLLFLCFLQIWPGAFYIIAVLALMIAAWHIQDWRYALAGLSVAALIVYSFHDVLLERLQPTSMGGQYVDELLSVNGTELIHGLGGWDGVLLTIGLVFVYGYLLLRSQPSRLALVAWFTPLFIAGALSRRFLFYSIPPLALILGTTLEALRPRRSHVALLLIALSLPLVYWDSVDYLAQKTPYVHSGLDHLLSAPLEEDAFIASWWSGGYHYQYLADRGTFTDPSSFADIRTTHIATALLTTNVSEAQSVLESLSCELRPPCEEPPTYVLVEEDLLGQAPGIAATIGEEVTITEIARCQKRGVISCTNGVRIGEKASYKGTTPHRLLWYGPEKRIIEYNNTAAFSIILYAIDGHLYSLLVDRAHDQSLFLRMLAHDTIPGFTLVRAEEFPEQIVLYKR